jgi:hypothetical protein
MRRRSRHATAIVSLAAVASVGFTLPTEAEAYEVRYDYYVYATQSDGIPIADDAILTGETFVSGSFTKNGNVGVGNYGTVDFLADIASGSVASYAHAYGARIGSTGYTATGRVESIAFADALSCLVPAGTYPDGVYVTLSGRVLGSLSSTLHAGAQAQYFISFGAESHGPAILAIGVSESRTLYVNDAFVLAHQLVAPGGTLATAQTYGVPIHAGFNGNRAWTSSSTPGEYTADATVDFYPGIQILSLEVPATVSCDSDSGVFLTEPPAAVPALSDEGQAVLFVALLGFAMWGLRQRPMPTRAVQQ